MIRENKLVNGLIPVATVCPFRKVCNEATYGLCAHKGLEHQVSFSCGYARLFNIMGTPTK